MVALYAAVAVLAVALAHIECWPAVAVLVPIGILMAYAGELRALRSKRRARRKRPTVAV